jgi:signal transduction histidine kinase
LKENTIDSLDTQGLKFFGQVTAAISHELKNIFAIISETTGFLNDLTQLARKGEKFDLSILENCNNSIAEEIERGFHTIRQMNKFAHSVDDPVKEIDVKAYLELVVKLTQFLSFAKKVNILPFEESIPVTTSPFLLQSLIYHVLCCLYKSTQEDEISVCFESRDDRHLHMIFSGPIQDVSDCFPSPDIKRILDILSIDAIVESEPFKLEMRIPKAANLRIKGI